MEVRPGQIINERLKVSIDFALKSTEGLQTITNCDGTLDAPNKNVTRAQGATFGR
jgi:hypothetical protein